MASVAPALRTLIVFWVALLVVIGGGAAALQVMGPPPAPVASVVVAAPPPLAAPTPDEPPRQRPPAPAGFAAANQAAGRDQREGVPSVTAGSEDAKPTPAAAPTGPPRIEPPAATMLEAAASFPGAMLPRIAPDGRTPLHAYARPFTLPPALVGAPQVALLVDGIGLSELDSRQAITDLPGEVDLAISAYAPSPAALLSLARERGHEFLVSIPMEPQGYPLNDEGIRALLTGADPDANRLNLQWALSRVQGYVGATGASDGLMGERLAQTPDAFAMVAEQLVARGLLYVDPRPGGALPAPLVGRSADLVLDEPAGAAEIDAKLAQLEQVARERGSALGVAGPPRPVTVQHLAAWARGLAARGVALVPITAMLPPQAAQQRAAAEPPAQH